MLVKYNLIALRCVGKIEAGNKKPENSKIILKVRASRYTFSYNSDEYDKSLNVNPRLNDLLQEGE